MGYGISAHGTTFKWGGNAVAELTSIGGPRISVDTIDVTSHDSSGKFREFVAGIGDGGEVSLEGMLYSGNTLGQVALVNDMLSRTLREMIITFPDGTTFTCNAIVTGFEPAAPFEDKLSFSATVKLSGLPSFGVSYADNLTGLVITTATLYPTFAGGTYVYTALGTGTSVTVTPTCAAADYITVNGNVVISAQASSSINVGATGTSTPIVVKTFKAGKTPRTYNITHVKTG